MFKATFGKKGFTTGQTSKSQKGVYKSPPKTAAHAKAAARDDASRGSLAQGGEDGEFVARARKTSKAAGSSLRCAGV